MPSPAPGWSSPVAVRLPWRLPFGPSGSGSSTRESLGLPFSPRRIEIRILAAGALVEVAQLARPCRPCRPCLWPAGSGPCRRAAPGPCCPSPDDDLAGAPQHFLDLGDLHLRARLARQLRDLVLHLPQLLRRAASSASGDIFCRSCSAAFCSSRCRRCSSRCCSARSCFSRSRRCSSRWLRSSRRCSSWSSGAARAASRSCRSSSRSRFCSSARAWSTWILG